MKIKSFLTYNEDEQDESGLNVKFNDISKGDAPSWELDVIAEDETILDE